LSSKKRFERFWVERYFPNLFKTNYENEMKEKEEEEESDEESDHEFIYDETSFSFCTAYSRRENVHWGK